MPASRAHAFPPAAGTCRIFIASSFHEFREIAAIIITLFRRGRLYDMASFAIFAREILWAAATKLIDEALLRYF